MDTLIDVVGWLGALFVLLAYWLVSSGRLKGTSFAFQAMNIGGALMLGTNAFWYGALPSVSVNAMWAFIGLWAVGRHRNASRSA